MPGEPEHVDMCVYICSACENQFVGIFGLESVECPECHQMIRRDYTEINQYLASIGEQPYPRS